MEYPNDVGDGDSYIEDDTLSAPYSSSDVKTSTPRGAKSLSHLDVTPDREFVASGDALELYVTATNWRRLRGLSQSISELNALKAKQEERRESGRFDDGLLTEHAMRLDAARAKMRALDAKYCKPQRYRSLSTLTSSDVARTRDKTLSVAKDPCFSPDNINNNNNNDNSRNMADVLGRKPTESLKLQEITADRTDCGQHMETGWLIRRREIGRPVTWAFDVDDGPPCLRANSWFHGSQELRNTGSVDNVSYLAGNRGMKDDNEWRKQWQSMPNLDTDDDALCDRELMYGDAIPVNHQDVTRQDRHKRLGRKSKMYVVAAGEATRRQTLGTWLFRKNRSLQCSSVTRSDIGDPREVQSLGKVIGSHPTTKDAYIIEVNRPPHGRYGFSLQNGSRKRKGVFVGKIRDKKASKFLGGLLNCGDEVLEINNNSLKEQRFSTVKKIVKNSRKLVLTILPSAPRTDA